MGIWESKTIKKETTDSHLYPEQPKEVDRAELKALKTYYLNRALRIGRSMARKTGCVDPKSQPTWELGENDSRTANDYGSQTNYRKLTWAEVDSESFLAFQRGEDKKGEDEEKKPADEMPGALNQSPDETKGDAGRKARARAVPIDFRRPEEDIIELLKQRIDGALKNAINELQPSQYAKDEDNREYLPQVDSEDCESQEQTDKKRQAEEAIPAEGSPALIVSTSCHNAEGDEVDLPDWTRGIGPETDEDELSYTVALRKLFSRQGPLTDRERRILEAVIRTDNETEASRFLRQHFGIGISPQNVQRNLETVIFKAHQEFGNFWHNYVLEIVRDRNITSLMCAIILNDTGYGIKKPTRRFIMDKHGVAFQGPDRLGVLIGVPESFVEELWPAGESETWEKILKLPHLNIRCGCEYLFRLINKCSGHVRPALAHFWYGEDWEAGDRNYGGKISTYVNKVFEDWQRLGGSPCEKIEWCRAS